MNSITTVIIAAVSAALYPWLLDAFHWSVTTNTGGGRGVLAALLLLAAFAVPLLNLNLASRATPGAGDIRARRFALLAVTAPTAYVFFGVLSGMAGSKLPDTWLWIPAWLLFGLWAAAGLSRTPDQTTAALRAPISARLRVGHGISGAVVALYVVFHLFNHLFGLVSPEAHAAVMDAGRAVYRATVIEPVLVAAMLFQIVSGLRLAWRWSDTGADRYRMFQVASGVFLSLFILGHMNSVFIYARAWMKIPTDWAFAAGLPTGLIHDAWNIRLLPHYALGVFFVLAHLASGLRVVMLTHGATTATANRVWWLGASFSVIVAAAIMCGLAGLHLG